MESTRKVRLTNLPERGLGQTATEFYYFAIIENEFWANLSDKEERRWR